MLKLLIITVFSITAFAEGKNYREQDIEKLVKRYDFLNELIEKYSNASPSSIRALQRDILNFEYKQKHGGANGAPTSETNKKMLQNQIDYLNNECALSKDVTCDQLKKEAEKYEKEYNESYTPEQVNYPEVNLKDYKYTFEGKTFDLKAH